ncbi:MAG: TIGR03086 family metal-binding protein [Acidimicrobiales bacterium]
MTNTEATDHHVPAPPSTPPPTSPTPGRLRRRNRLGGSTLARITTDRLGDPTPCDSFDVAALAAHHCSSNSESPPLARGLDPFSVPHVAVETTPGPSSRRGTPHQPTRRAFGPTTPYSPTLALPFATLPGIVALHIYTSEVLVHTWDLATAIGVDVDWDNDVVLGALVMMTNALPADGRGDEVPFGDVVEVADDARPIDRLVAWLGRTPS